MPMGHRVSPTSSYFLKYPGNRLLNWPKLLGLHADGFSSICVPECVPYIIPHMFQKKSSHILKKTLCFRPLLMCF